MYILKKIKQNILIVSFATLLAGCGGGGTTGSTDTTSTATTTLTLKVVEVQINELITTENSVTIEWAPNGYTSKLIEYGTDRKYGSELLVKDEGTITLFNLQTNTTYHYRIVAEDKNGREVVSKDNTFTTLEQSTEPIVTEPVPIEPIDKEIQAVCIEGDAKIEGHVTDKDTGAGLVGVQVNVGGCVATTDAEGDYTLTNIATNYKEVVTFSAEGYYKNSTIIQIDQYNEGTTDLSPNYTEIKLDKYISHWDYDSQTVVSESHITIPAGIYINNDGSPYDGQVTAGLSYRTSAEKGTDTVFPGEYKGENNNGIIIPFVSYGFTVIDLTDVNGATLSLSEDITLTFEATGATESIIPLWYYNYEQGLWIEEGYAQLQTNGTYQGAVSHPGTWSLNRPIEEEVGIYRGHILNEDGSPMSDVRLYAVGENWIASDLSTDKDGMFEIEVIPGSSFQLAAYDYKNKYGANYVGVISAVASGEIVED